jgi:hypothetical protein
MEGKKEEEKLDRNMDGKIDRLSDKERKRKRLTDKGCQRKWLSDKD